MYFKHSTQRERERERQTDRQTDRQTELNIHRMLKTWYVLKCPVPENLWNWSDWGLTNFFTRYKRINTLTPSRWLIFLQHIFSIMLISKSTVLKSSFTSSFRKKFLMNPKNSFPFLWEETCSPNTNQQTIETLFPALCCVGVEILFVSLWYLK